VIISGQKYEVSDNCKGGGKCASLRIYICGMSTEGKYVARGGFYIKAAELKAAVQRFKHVIPKGDADEILTRLLMYQIKDRLELQGSDGEIYASFALKVEPLERFLVGGGMAVSYYWLRDYLKYVPEKAILKCIFADNEKGIPYMLIESERGTKSFYGIDSYNYPKATKFYCSNIAMMKVDDFRDMVARTIFAVDDMPYSRLGGVYFHCLPDRTRFVATNRAILSMYERTDVIFRKPESVVVPIRVLQAFMAGIKGLSGGENVLIYISEGHIQLAYNGFVLFSKCLGEDFPDYARVIPKETPHVVTFDRDKLREAVKRLKVVTNREVSRIEFAFSGDSVELYAPNAQQEGGSTEKVVCNYAGDTIKISFCADFLLPILENIKSERIIMRIASNIRPVIIEPESQPLLFNMLCLIMPLAGK
jgi:DNA polymerase-3 subunit beta